MFDDYISVLVSQGRSSDTIKTYKTQLTKFFSWLESNNESAEPEEITSIDAVEYRSYLQGQGKKPATINTALRSIEAYCTWLVGEGRMGHNPLSKVKKVEQVQEVPKWLDKSEKYRLIRTAIHEKDKRNEAIVLTLLLAGLRASEIINLTPEDIALSERKGSITVKAGKGNKRRVVPIPKELRECLGEYLTERATKRWLFDSQRGEKLTYIGLYQFIDSIGKKAHIDNLTPHVLRHTYCHDLVNKGVRIELVAKLAGHSKIETTMIYTQPGEQEMQTAVEKLGFS